MPIPPGTMPVALAMPSRSFHSCPSSSVTSSSSLRRRLLLLGFLFFLKKNKRDMERVRESGASVQRRGGEVSEKKLLLN